VPERLLNPRTAAIMATIRKIKAYLSIRCVG
jgi:hypothetical protein